MKTIFNTLTLMLLPTLLFGQLVKDADFISPMEDGFAAFNVENEWGFMDESGKKTVSLRKDLIFNEKVTIGDDIGVASMPYPLMINERAVVKKIKDGIPYYGFIDTNGTVVIKPEFLNVSNFKDGYAMALKLSEEVLGENKALGKRVVRYFYDLVLINNTGEITSHLCGPFPITISKNHLAKAPPIVAKDIAPNLIAVQTPAQKWEVITID